MKKKTIANLIMVVLILAIAVAYEVAVGLNVVEILLYTTPYLL